MQNMVVFVCNNCNDSLKKPQVELHLSRSRCQGCSVSCLDCHRDFDRQSVKHHIKCVTEEERYSGGNFKPKVSTVNGERKRNEWMELVQRVASQKDPSRPPQVQQLLKVCAGMQSVPAKQRAFENFIHNSQKPYINYAESAWNILQKERDATIVVNSPSKPTEKQDQSAEVMEVDASPVKSGKKNKKGKENEEETENLESQGDTEEGKKKKKQKLLEDIKPDLEGAEVNSNKKKKKKKSLVSLKVDDESTPDAEEMVAESKKKKKKSVVSGEEGTSEVLEIPVESKKKKKQSVASAEESTPVEEVAVDSKKKKKKSMVSAEPDIEGL
ncbi:hypothetical protein B566_EDAN005128 [Ephemera danica]|nr:hypothetical protein B566_EDAN005128 [Ephemera danica]